MSTGKDQKKIYQDIADRIEDIHGVMDELFGEDSSEDGLLSVRASMLHQFGVFASTYHHINAIDFVKNSEKISKIFEEEIQTANIRTSHYRGKAKQKLLADVASLEDYLAAIVELVEEIEYVKFLTSEQLNEFSHSYYLSILQSITFYLQEISVRILDPAVQMLEAEVAAANKLMDTLEMYDRSFPSDEVTPEDVARMAEVLSWGLEIPPGWQSVQNSSNELNSNLKKKLGSLKALVTTYYNH